MTLNIQNSPQPAGNAWWDSLPDEVKRAISYANSTPSQPPGGATPPVRPFNSFANAPPMGQDGSNWTPPPLTYKDGSPPPAAPTQDYGGPTAAADAAGPRGPAWSNMPWPSQAPASTQHPVLQPHPAVVAAAANALPKRPVQGPPQGPQNSAFTQIAAPNMTGMGGALGRGGARPMMSALDLSSLFGNHPNPA